MELYAEVISSASIDGKHSAHVIGPEGGEYVIPTSKPYKPGDKIPVRKTGTVTFKEAEE